MEKSATTIGSSQSPHWWKAEKSARFFRLSWIRLYGVMAAWSTAILFLLAVFQGNLTLLAIMTVFATVHLLAIGFAAIISQLFGTRVGEGGLRGFTFWGLPSRMLWQEIDSARYSHLLGLPWLVVRSRTSGSALWLPLFYADSRGFLASVMQFAPHDCPILTFASPSDSVS